MTTPTNETTTSNKVPNKPFSSWWRSDYPNPVYVYQLNSGMWFDVNGKQIKVEDDGHWQGECVRLKDGDVVLSKEHVHDVICYLNEAKIQRNNINLKTVGILNLIKLLEGTK